MRGLSLDSYRQVTRIPLEWRRDESSWGQCRILLQLNCKMAPAESGSIHNFFYSGWQMLAATNCTEICVLYRDPKGRKRREKERKEVV